MKKIVCCLLIAVAILQCSQDAATKKRILPDGFYEVMAEGKDTGRFGHNRDMLVVPYNSIYDERNTESYRNYWLQIDTADYVPLELDTLPLTELDSLQKKRLSITLSPGSIGKLESFTAKRIMKSIAIVLDGEAITMHKVRDTIHGGTMQISWCGENACGKLYTRLKASVKK